MGESEATSITWSSEPKPTAEHEADLREIARQKQALEIVTLPLRSGKAAQVQAKKRVHKPATERLYARLREVPRDMPLEKAAQMFDNAQRPFPVPKHLRDRGWPDSWVKAWKGAGFRRKLHDLKQHAWQAKPKN